MPSRAARRFLVYAVLSTSVSHFRSFSLVYAVNFAVSIFCLWLLNCGLFGPQMTSRFYQHLVNEVGRWRGTITGPAPSVG